MRLARKTPWKPSLDARQHFAPSPGRAPRRGWVLAVMCTGMFWVILDVTVVNVALPAIGTGMHADLPQLQWIVTAYTVTFAALLLAGGTLGDISGHKLLVLVSCA